MKAEEGPVSPDPDLQRNKDKGVFKVFLKVIFSTVEVG